MNFIQRIGQGAKSVWSAIKSASVPVAYRVGRSLGGITYGKSVSQQFESWVFACVTAISQDVAKAKLHLKQKNRDGSEQILFDHPAINLLKKPNERFTLYTLMYRLQANLELRGEEYWFIEFKNGIPFEIYPLPAGKVSCVGGKFEYIDYYQYKTDSGVINIPKENIIPFWNFHPDSDIMGKATLEAASDSVQTDDYARDYNRSFFENSAQPGVVLEYPTTLSQEQLQRLKADWNQQYGGPRNQNRTAVAHGGLKINRLEQTHADMQFSEQRKYSRDEILAIFRVPKEILGIFEDANYAGSKTANSVFAMRTVDPKVRMIVDTLGAFYIPLFKDPSLSIGYEEIVQEDRAELSSFLTAGVAGGYMTPNEARQTIGLPALENGDTTYLPFNLVPGSALAKKESGEVSFKEKKTKALAEAIAHEIKNIIPKEVLSAPKTTMDDEKLEHFGAKRIEISEKSLKPYETRLKNSMEDLFDKQKKTAIAALENELKRKDWKASSFDLLDEAKEIKVTLDLFKPIFEAMVKVSGQAAFDFLGLRDEFSTSYPTVSAFIQENSELFAGEVTRVTTDAIRQAVSEGVTLGESIEDLKKRIVNLSDFSEARAEVIARTETVRASGKTDLLAWEISGVVESSVWFTAEDERVCSICGPLHGKEVGLNKAFVTQDEMDELGISDYDGIIKSPPAHPQCRCALIPVVASGKTYSKEYQDELLFAQYITS